MEVVLQIPSEKVFRPQKTPPKAVSEGVWSCRVWKTVEEGHSQQKLRFSDLFAIELRKIVIYLRKNLDWTRENCDSHGERGDLPR